MRRPFQSVPVPAAGRAWPGLLALIFGLLIPLAAAAAEGPLQASDLRMAGDASRARIVVELSDEPALNWSLLRSPYRLVVELPATEFRFRDEALEPISLITEVRHGAAGSSRARLVFTMDGPFAVETAEILKNETSPGYRLVVDLVAASEREFEQALAGQIATTGATGTAGSGTADRVTIVLDPGHGGIDAGATGVTGTLEKTITLAFALELKAALEKNERYEVHLTRDRDIFLRLDERVRIARRKEADLFISIHADAIRHRSVRGATVYTVSDSASDAASAAKAIRENLADEVGGYSVEAPSDAVSDILVDLVRRETQRFSLRFAKALVSGLSEEILMINNPHRYAGFRVLRAPDIPSVLLELGYLSNPKDEGLLRDADWRAQASEGISAAISKFVNRKFGSTGN